jgi:signal transduction histidine kinase
MTIGPISQGATPLKSGGDMDVETIRDWVCAFAEQTIEHVILLLAPDLTVLWANPVAAEILAMDLAAIVGGPIHRFFTPEDLELGIPEHEAAIADSRGASEDDRWMMRADGSLFWATGRTVSLNDASGDKVGSLKIFRNQTDMKMRISTLGNRVDALQVDDKARIAALATLSHEVRNPLSVVYLYTAIVEREIVDPELKSHLRAIRDNLDAIARLVEDLDDATRVTTGKLTLRIERVLLHELLDAALEAAMERAGCPGRRIEWLLPPGQPIVFDGDPQRLQQLFANLFGNAIKFTRDGQRIWIKASIETPNVVVRIEDEGLGIPPHLLDSIFEMFSQAPTNDDDHAGLGIGLALVKNIVELHGGNVQARSNGIGTGAEFVVRLPLEPA